MQADRPKGDLRKFSLTVSLQYKAEGRQLLSGGTVTAESRALQNSNTNVADVAGGTDRGSNQLVFNVVPKATNKILQYETKEGTE